MMMMMNLSQVSASRRVAVALSSSSSFSSFSSSSSSSFTCLIRSSFSRSFGSSISDSSSSDQQQQQQQLLQVEEQIQQLLREREERQKQEKQREKQQEPKRLRPRRLSNLNVVLFGSDRFTLNVAQTLLQSLQRKEGLISSLSIVFPHHLAVKPSRHLIRRSERNSTDIAGFVHDNRPYLRSVFVYPQSVSKHEGFRRGDFRVFDWNPPKGILKADLAIVASYGHMIPDEVLRGFPMGVVNLHPSLLPKYRGASPIQTAIMNGDQETGVSLAEIYAGAFDAGPVLVQRKYTMPSLPAFGRVHDDLANMASELLMWSLPRLPRLRLNPIHPGFAKGQAPPLDARKLGAFDHYVQLQDRSGKSVRAHFLAFQGYRDPWIYLEDSDMRQLIIDMEVGFHEDSLPAEIKALHDRLLPGVMVADLPNNRLLVRCDPGWISITTLRPACRGDVNVLRWLHFSKLKPWTGPKDQESLLPSVPSPSATSAGLERKKKNKQKQQQQKQGEEEDKQQTNSITTEQNWGLDPSRYRVFGRFDPRPISCRHEELDRQNPEAVANRLRLQEEYRQEVAAQAQERQEQQKRLEELKQERLQWDSQHANSSRSNRHFRDNPEAGRGEGGGEGEEVIDEQALFSKSS